MNKEIKKNKFRLYIFSGIFAIAGLIILVFGAVTRVNAAQISTASSSALAAGADTLITFGCIVIAMTIIGVAGAIREKRFLIVIYTIFLSVLIIVQIGMGISALVQSRTGGTISLTLDIQYPMMFKVYWYDELTAVTIDNLQVGMKCCGIHSPNDFLKLRYGIPGSCCGKFREYECLPFEIYRDGCLPLLKELAVWSGNVFGGVCLGLGVFEFVGVAIALLLVSALKKALQASRAGRVYAHGPMV